VDGNPFPRISWSKGKVEVAEGIKYKTELDTSTGIATLNITKCRQTDESVYAITIQNDHGEAQVHFNLYVKGRSHVADQVQCHRWVFYLV
jgi:hypothetical protein